MVTRETESLGITALAGALCPISGPCRWAPSDLYPMDHAQRGYIHLHRCPFWVALEIDWFYGVRLVLFHLSGKPIYYPK